MMLSRYEEQRKDINLIKNDAIADISSSQNHPIPSTNANALLRYGLWLGASYSLHVFYLDFILTLRTTRDAFRS